MAVTVTTYTPVYPPAHSDTYVKATSKRSTSYWPYYATNPAKSLVGAGDAAVSWLGNTYRLLRFHIDLGSANIVRQIYYENYHNAGLNTNRGVENFTFWGSNEATAFAQLTYITDTDWTQLTTSATAFDEHSGSDAPDPKYILVTNSTAYRYYAIKCEDSWGASDYVGLRRIVMQTEDGYSGASFIPSAIWF